MQLFKQDAVEWLSTLPDGSVDLLITDPPYESLEKHRAVGTTTRLKKSKGSSNQWFSIFRASAGGIRGLVLYCGSDSTDLSAEIRNRSAVRKTLGLCAEPGREMGEIQAAIFLSSETYHAERCAEAAVCSSGQPGCLVWIDFPLCHGLPDRRI